MTKEEHEEIIRSIINKHLENMRNELFQKDYSIKYHFHWEPRRFCKNNNQ